MPLLPGLAVVFAGLVGGGHKPADRAVAQQVKTLVHELHVKPIAMPASAVRTLTHHGDATRAVVRRLHANGVLGCEIVTGHGTPTLRVVIYTGDGGLKTYTEVSIGSHGLSSDDLEVLRSNLSDDVTSLGGTPDAEPEPAPAPAPEPMHRAAPTPKPAPASDQEIEMDSPPAADATPAASGSDDSAKTQTADASADDAVSADEIEAMTSGGGNEVDAHTTAGQPVLHFGATVGMGIASRFFTPSPSTVAAYSTSPVGSIVAEAHVEPTARTSLGVSTERSLSMTTPMRDGSIAATDMSRWDVYGSYQLVHGGRVEIGTRLGFGRRGFSIQSTDPARSPDGDYQYIIAGVEGSMHVGKRVQLHALAAIEPVVSGTQPTEMAFGPASRYAVEVGGALEYRPYDHLYARLAAEYQRFTWSWDMAGARGAGGAVDEYPSGSLSIGADY